MPNCHKILKEQIKLIGFKYYDEGLSIEELNCIFPNYKDILKHNKQSILTKKGIWVVISASALLIIAFIFQFDLPNIFYGMRCMVPNNYFIWEGTRPISNCEFCTNVTKPIVFENVTKEQFLHYAYSSKPIIIKRAFLHWPAIKRFSWDFFRDLYASVEGSYESVDEECQFLHFKSNFISIKDVFTMDTLRGKNLIAATSWYVGWGNCHPTILQQMRQYYPKPHFLPSDAEIPHKEYIFMGYGGGATMHLDFINRLMWQAQLKGKKDWHLLPPPECESICKSVEFQVEGGDGVLVDTRVWYHATKVPDGEFSLSIQSEYG